jgi:hypothetical protein
VDPTWTGGQHGRRAGHGRAAAGAAAAATVDAAAAGAAAAVAAAAAGAWQLANGIEIRARAAEGTQ